MEAQCFKLSPQEAEIAAQVCKERCGKAPTASASKPPTWQSEDGRIQLWQGDCRELLPMECDAVVTDPPYGMNYVVKAQVVGSGNRRVLRGGKPPVIGDDKSFCPESILSIGAPTILFGANYFHTVLPQSSGWLVWDKTGGGRGPDNNFADLEIAWTNFLKQPQLFSHLWKGLVRDSEAGQKVIHATQKPVPLMQWCIGFLPNTADVILDPFMGSGTTGIACIRTGRQFRGIELDAKYFQIAKERIENELKQQLLKL